MMGVTKSQMKYLSVVITSGKSAEYYTAFNILVKLIILAITISLIDLNVVQCEESQIQYKFMPLAAKDENQVKKISCPSEPTIEFGNEHDGVNTDMLPKFNMLVEDEMGNVQRVQHDGLISMYCKGNHPVTWQFQGVTNLSEIIKSIEIIRSSPDPRDSSTFCYTACLNFTMPRPKKFAGAGLYTCSYLGDVKNQKSLYLYGNDNLPNMLAKLDGTDHIKVESFSTDEVNLPCLGNWPNMTVQLTKQISEDDFQPLNSSVVDIKYDSKHGFIITKKNVSDSETNLDGTYKCRTQDAGGLKNDVVTVRNTFAGAKPERSNKMEITVQEYNNCKRFVCWSKSQHNNRNETDTDANKLQMFVMKCNNPLQCQLTLSFLERGVNPTHHYKSEPDTCGHISDISSESQISSIKINSKYTAGVVICRTSDKKKFQYSQFFRSVNSSRDTVLLDSNNNLSDDLKTNTRSHISEQIDPASVISMELSSRMYVKEHHEIICDTSNFLFANGSKLLVQYANGSFSPPQILKTKQHFFNEGLKTESDTVVNITSKDIVAFVCLAPLWNSDRWMNLTFPVSVSEGVLPEFIRTSNPHLLMYDTEVNQTLICEATGSPPPILEWYKNEEPFEDNTNNAHSVIKYTQNSTISELHFKSVSYNAMNIAGIYVCNATNIKGTQLYSITVGVESYSTTKYWVSFSGVVLFVAMVVLAFYLIKFWKKSVKQRKYIRQLTKDDIRQFEYGRQSVKVSGDDASVCARSGLSDYANVSGGVEHALDQPYDKRRFEISTEDLIIDHEFKLGEGNYGMVLKGTLYRQNSKFDVAVKMLKEWDVTAAKTLLSELKILMYIDKHDNVVSLLGAVTNYAKFEIQLVLEFCSEGSLEKFLRSKKGLFLDEVERDGEIHYSQPICNNNVKSNYVKADFGIRTFDLIRWAHQFATGMEYVASRKIIHGDLAARNLLLTDSRQLKITDFGLSKKLKNYQRNYIPSISSTEREQPWRSLAPECWKEDNQLSTESDVWAYGITLWEIFSLGDEPYPDYPYYTPHYVKCLLEGYRMGKPKYATSKIYNVMLNCWEREPQNRPSFSMLVAEFESLLPQNYVSFIRGTNCNFEAQKESQPLPAAAPKAFFNAGYILPDQLEFFEIQE